MFPVPASIQEMAVIPTSIMLLSYICKHHLYGGDFQNYQLHIFPWIADPNIQLIFCHIHLEIY